MEEVDYSNYLVYIKTSHTGIIKSIFDRLSTQFAECPMVFTPMEDGEGEPDENYYEEMNNPILTSKAEKAKRKIGGLRIHQFKPTGDLLVVVNLFAHEFQEFYCESRTSVGIDVQRTHKAINNLQDSDVITMYILKSNPTSICINSMRNDSEDKSGGSTTITITLSHPQNENMPLKKAVPERRLTMSMAAFKKVCKAASEVSPIIEIRTCNNDVTFKSVNDTTTYERTFTDLSRGNKPDKDHVVIGQYNVRTLMDFSKSENLSKQLDINMRNDFPLILNIKTGSLGRMSVIVAPNNPVGGRGEK